MRNKGVICCLLLAVLTLVGCGNRQTSRNLQLARKLMDSIPDSTYALVTAIDPEMLSGEKRALHSLLLAHSRYRTYRDDTSDSLASVAVDYYSNRLFADSELLTAALFIQGRNRLNADRYEAAMESAVRSLCEAQTAGNMLYQARAHELIADIYAANYLGTPAADHYRHAARAYSSANKPRHSIYCSIYEANSIGAHLALYDLAIDKLDSIKSHVTAKDTSTNLLISSSALYSLYHKGDSARAKKESLFILNNTTDPYYLYDAYAILAEIALDNKQLDIANHYIRKLVDICESSSSYDSNVLLTLKYKLNLLRGDKEALIHIQDSIIRALNNIQIITSGNLDSTETSVIRQQKHIVEQQAKSTRIFGSIVTAILGIVIIISIILNVLRNKREQLHRIYYIEQAKALSEQICAQQSKLDSIQLRVSELIMEQTKTRVGDLNNLCLEFSETIDGAPDAQRRLYSKVRDRIASLRTADFVSQLEDTIMSISEDERISLLALKKRMKPRDYEFLLFVLCGFSHRSLCVIFELQSSSIYSRKDKLRRLFNNSLKEFATEFILRQTKSR